MAWPPVPILACPHDFQKKVGDGIKVKGRGTNFDLGTRRRADFKLRCSSWITSTTMGFTSTIHVDLGVELSRKSLTCNFH